ncbi:MAG: hypothetical protein Q7R87_04755 [Nanoarchaeota archaeon]|nr:hypothetical protein [Nanoarchaeota archaeon]
MKGKEGGKNRVDIVRFPWKKLIVLLVIIIAIIVLLEIFKDYSNEISISLTEQISKLNLPFSINPYVLIVICLVIIYILFILILWIVKKIKDNSSFSGDVNDSNADANKLHTEEELLKKKLHEIRKKSFELAKKSKDKKAREHHASLKNESEIPIESKQDIKKVLRTVDELLGKLPEEEINKFAETNEAKNYKEILKKYGVK